MSSGEVAMAGGALALGAEGEGVRVLGSGGKEGVERGGARRLCLEATGLGRVKERGAVQGVAGAGALKASRPLIRVLVINDNGLWINDFI